MRAAGIHGTPHALRHWYGSELVDRGGDLRTVQELMRHEWLTSTQIYTRVTETAERRALDRLPGMTGESLWGVGEPPCSRRAPLRAVLPPPPTDTNPDQADSIGTRALSA